MPSTTFLDNVLGRFFKNGNIKIRDPETVEEKILALVNGGPDSLQIITDFDQTLTKYHLQNGEICDSTYSVLTNCSLLTKQFKIESEQNLKKYAPIEINHEMSIEERIPYMLEWQHAFLKSLMKSKVDKALIKTATEKSKIPLRDNAKRVLEKLDKVNIPVLIFSAGIEDVLCEILIQNDATFPNIRVISNKLEFNEDKLLVGFYPPSIHTFNKNKTVLGDKNKHYFTELGHRHHAILLGDKIGDVNMADGMNREDIILKIGFLEEKIDAQLEYYMTQYDIVILDDQSWDLFDVLLNNILKIEDVDSH